MEAINSKEKIDSQIFVSQSGRNVRNRYNMQIRQKKEKVAKKGA